MRLFRVAGEAHSNTETMTSHFLKTLEKDIPIRLRLKTQAGMQVYLNKIVSNRRTISFQNSFTAFSKQGKWPHERVKNKR